MNASEIANWTAGILQKQSWLGAAGGPHAHSFGAGLGGGASLWTLLSSFTSPSDLLKIFIVGGAIETLRRVFWRAWATLLSYFYLTATLETTEPSYQWMLVWLAQRQAWNTSRAVLITQSAQGETSRNMAPVQRHNAEASKHDRPIEFQPMFGTKCSIWYKGSWIQIHRLRGNAGMSNVQFMQPVADSLSFTILFGGHQKLKGLLTEAKDLYKSRVANRIRIWSSHSGNRGWTTSMVRPKRGMESVVLDEGIKTMLVEDAREFLRSEQWYADRGIPWRRGYLLYGCPGSGKTSLIHAIAGELDLDIYVISLSQRDMDDSALNRLITTLPAKSIALMEDIDVAFTRGPARDQGNNSNSPMQPGFSQYGTMEATMMPSNNSGGGITLAGLLGAIDGVAAQEGRILFASTNRYHALDSALKRPGRLDLHLEFKEANRKQAEELFKRFYPANIPKDSNVAAVASTDIEKPLIDLTNEANDESLSSISEKTDSTMESQNPILPTHTRPLEAPSMTESELSTLAKQFASLLPEGEFSMATIQGHLMRYKTQPHRAIAETEQFVEKERKQKEIEAKAREQAVQEAKEKKEKKEDREEVGGGGGNAGKGESEEVEDDGKGLKSAGRRFRKRAGVDD